MYNLVSDITPDSSRVVLCCNDTMFGFPARYMEVYPNEFCWLTVEYKYLRIPVIGWKD